MLLGGARAKHCENIGSKLVWQTIFYLLWMVERADMAWRGWRSLGELVLAIRGGEGTVSASSSNRQCTQEYDKLSVAKFCGGTKIQI